MPRTIDTHTHILDDDTIKLLQKEIPSLGLKLTPSNPTPYNGTDSKS